jgi:hypothetical protein
MVEAGEIRRDRSTAENWSARKRATSRRMRYAFGRRMVSRSRAPALLVALVATGMSGVAVGQPVVDEPLDPWHGSESTVGPLQLRDLRRSEIVEPWLVDPRGDPAERGDAPSTEPDELVDPWRGDPLHPHSRELPDPWADEASLPIEADAVRETEPSSPPALDPPTARFPLVQLPTQSDAEPDVKPPEPRRSSSRAAFPLLE